MNEYAEITQMLSKGTVVQGLDFNNPLVFPFFPATAFRKRSLTEAMDASISPFSYIRINNPNREALAEVVNYLEQGEKSLIFSAGMGAISTTLFALLEPGDEIICNRNIYGETHRIMSVILKKFRISTNFVNFDDIQNIRDAITPKTKLIYSEVCSNPVLHVADVPEIAKIAHQNNCLLMIDNTFTTPIAIKPFTLGADIVINSLTKYMNGHSDVIGGSITTSAELMKQIEAYCIRMGTSGDPYASFTMLKNFGTMHLRVRTQMANAAKLAKALEENQLVKKVNHPSLKSYPQHELAMKLFEHPERISGMLSFELSGDIKKVDEFMSRLSFVSYAGTLGGIHTTLMHPVSTSHKEVPVAEREAMGITSSLMRISTGIEDADDLIAEFNYALEVLA
ncbi:aminotransferase class I/II-fold pyridoxal phosphate-dependent enzyme [Eubacteriales bacterium OttesenSCG-928-K08]|nr:aminotransferase class I/II-fold pyridoxal phosphate-dependent enzyme [Eubacteriales bacterium OttesenSCG-928-K08]